MIYHVKNHIKAIQTKVLSAGLLAVFQCFNTNVTTFWLVYH